MMLALLWLLPTVLLATCVSARVPATTGPRYSSFPFCKCPAEPQLPYSLETVVPVIAPEAGKHCFKLRAQVPANCVDRCCRADVRKIEFHVNAACANRSTRVSASVNGQPTKVGPAFDKPKQGPAGAAVLRLTQLGLGLGDDGAEVCISLKPNGRDAPGCTSLQALCVPAAGQPAGTCSAALFDTSGGCCSKSQVDGGGGGSTSPSPTPSPLPTPSPSPSPPPPSPPPPPPSPPPPPNRWCRSCITLTLELLHNLPDWLTEEELSHAKELYHSRAFCDNFTNQVSNQMNSLMFGINIIPLYPHGYDPLLARCSPVIQTCTTFSYDRYKSVHDAQVMGLFAQGKAVLDWLQAITGSNGIPGTPCHPVFRGYKVTISDTADTCISNWAASISCPPGDPPSPPSPVSVVAP